MILCVTHIARYYVDADFICGNRINVFGRDMLLTGCDGFTKRFYQKHHHIDQITVRQVIEAPKVNRREMAPYNGWGSEEDSMANCINLVPKKTKTDLSLFLKHTGQVLRFTAKIADPKMEDMDRRFTIAFYLEDDTCMVNETAVRNSGGTGGKFLERGKYKIPGAEKVNVDGRSAKIRMLQVRMIDISLYSCIDIEAQSTRGNMEHVKHV